jgi:hypothetical protein
MRLLRLPLRSLLTAAARLIEHVEAAGSGGLFFCDLAADASLRDDEIKRRGAGS